MGQLHGAGALEEDGIDLAAQQPGQLQVAAFALAAGYRCTGHIAHRAVAEGAVVVVVDQRHVAHLQAFELQGVFQPTQGLGAGEVDLRRGPVGQAEAAPLEVFDRVDATVWAGQDQLRLIGPGQPDHACVPPLGTGPDRRNAATVAHRVAQAVVEVRFAHRLLVGLAQRLHLGAEAGQVVLQPALLHGDAQAGGYWAAGIPQGVEGVAHVLAPVGFRRWPSRGWWPQPAVPAAALPGQCARPLPGAGWRPG